MTTDLSTRSTDYVHQGQIKAKVTKWKTCSSIPQHIRPPCDATIYINGQGFKTRLCDVMSGAAIIIPYNKEGIDKFIRCHIKDIVKYGPEFFANHSDPSQKMYDAKSFINSDAKAVYLLGGMLKYRGMIYLVSTNGQQSISKLYMKEVYTFSDKLDDNFDHIKLLVNPKFILEILTEIGQEILKENGNKCQMKVDGDFVYFVK